MMSPVPADYVGKVIDFRMRSGLTIVGELDELTPFQYVVRCLGEKATTTWRLDRAAVEAMAVTE